jgi:hypothetical protein
MSFFLTFSQCESRAFEILNSVEDAEKANVQVKVYDASDFPYSQILSIFRLTLFDPESRGWWEKYGLTSRHEGGILEYRSIEYFTNFGEPRRFTWWERFKRGWE